MKHKSRFFYLSTFLLFSPFLTQIGDASEIVAQTDWREWSNRNPVYEDTQRTITPQPTYKGLVKVEELRLSSNYIGGKFYPRLKGIIKNSTNTEVTNVRLRYEVTKKGRLLDVGSFCALNCKKYSLKRGQSMPIEFSVDKRGDAFITRIVWEYPDGSMGVNNYKYGKK